MIHKIDLHGLVNVVDGININSISVASDASFNGSVYIKEQLDLDGDASFNSSVDITNNLNTYIYKIIKWNLILLILILLVRDYYY